MASANGLITKSVGANFSIKHKQNQGLLQCYVVATLPLATMIFTIEAPSIYFACGISFFFKIAIIAGVFIDTIKTEDRFVQAMF